VQYTEWMVNTKFLGLQIDNHLSWKHVCWDWGFESCWGHGCQSLVSSMCCQVEVTMVYWWLIQGSPTD
jgi:hypothetical protein